MKVIYVFRKLHFKNTCLCDLIYLTLLSRCIHFPSKCLEFVLYSQVVFHYVQVPYFFYASVNVQILGNREIALGKGKGLEGHGCEEGDVRFNVMYQLLTMNAIFVCHKHELKIILIMMMK